MMLLRSHLLRVKTGQFSLLSIVHLDDPRGPEMLEALFNKGADPNRRLRESLLWPKSLTPWETALVRITVAFSDGSGYDRDQLSNISKCACLMIDHGAKVDWPSVNSAMSVFQPSLESRVKEGIYL